jgi:hypothetical protein
MRKWNHALQGDMAEDHAVLRQYPELGVKMNCKRCHADIAPVLMCLCMPRVSPVVSLDSSVGSTLRGMRAAVAVVLKAGCSMPGSSKQTATAPCTYDVFLRLVCVRPDVSDNNWPSPCPEGIVYKPKKASAAETAQARCVSFTQRSHTVTCFNNTIVARLLAQHQGGSTNSSKNCWEQCFVHATTGVVCAVAAPVTFTHITNNTTAADDHIVIEFDTIKHDPLQGVKFPHYYHCQMKKSKWTNVDFLDAGFILRFLNECPDIKGKKPMIQKHKAAKLQRTQEQATPDYAASLKKALQLDTDGFE